MSDDEQVLVFPCYLLKRLKGLPGIASHHVNVNNLQVFADSIVPELRLMRRGDVEDDPTMLQLIPYVVVESADRKRVLMYNRGNKGGETRLADKWSIGVGGHINPEDGETVVGNNLGDDYLGFIRNSASRELREELRNWEDRDTIQYWAFLHTDDSAVNAVHFCCILKIGYSGDEGTLEAAEEGVVMEWVKKEDLKDYVLESWSEMIRDHLLD